MFERFTDRARRVIVLAREEAEQLGHGYIDTEHILLALVHESDGVAAQVLVASGLDLNRVRQQVLELTHGPHQAGAERAPGTVADDDLLERLTSIAARLDAIERRLRQSGP